MAHLTMSLILCSSGSTRESRYLKGRRLSSKSPSRVRDGDEGVAGRNRREKYVPNEGSLIFLTTPSPPFCDTSLQTFHPPSLPNLNIFFCLSAWFQHLDWSLEPFFRCLLCSDLLLGFRGPQSDEGSGTPPTLNCRHHCQSSQLGHFRGEYAYQYQNVKTRSD